MYFYLKALHIIFAVTWFAGLFYLVRLFIYHVEAQNNIQEENIRNILISQFQTMERRLWYGITWPSAVLTLVCGIGLVGNFLPLKEYPWLGVKLGLILLLFGYHLFCGYLYRQMLKGKHFLGSYGLRIWNEVATLFLFGIVFLAVLRDSLDAVTGIAGTFILGGILFFGINIYRNTKRGKRAKIKQ